MLAGGGTLGCVDGLTGALAEDAGEEERRLLPQPAGQEKIQGERGSHACPCLPPRSGCVSAPPLPHPQEEKAVIKADADERQAFADRLSLSFPVVKEEEGDVALAKRTAFHHTGQHSARHWACLPCVPVD